MWRASLTQAEALAPLGDRDLEQAGLGATQPPGCSRGWSSLPAFLACGVKRRPDVTNSWEAACPDCRHGYGCVLPNCVLASMWLCCESFPAPPSVSLLGPVLTEALRACPARCFLLSLAGSSVPWAPIPPGHGAGAQEYPGGNHPACETLPGSRRPSGS